MSSSIGAVFGIGLVLGFRHAFEPDHLAAVSTLATRQASLASALRLGAAWALGHSVSVGLAVATLVGLKLRLPARLLPLADVGVGVLLVGLGASVIVRYLRGRWHMHLHRHSNRESHLHLHSHAAEHSSHQHAHGSGDARRSLGFGLLHGLAGSGAILVLLVVAAPTRGAQLAYFAAFGLGTVGGMMLVSAVLATTVRLASQRGERWAAWLHLGSAVASVVVGVVLAVRTVFTL